MKRKTQTKIITIIFTLLLITLSVVYASELTTVCIRVVDGDTIIISGGERVRLIGIDTPEVYQSNKLYKDATKSGGHNT